MFRVENIYSRNQSRYNPIQNKNQNRNWNRMNLEQNKTRIET